MAWRRASVWALALAVVGLVAISHDAFKDLIAETLTGEAAAFAALGAQVVFLAAIFLVGRWVEAHVSGPPAE